MKKTGLGVILPPPGGYTKVKLARKTLEKALLDRVNNDNIIGQTDTAMEQRGGLPLSHKVNEEGGIKRRDLHCILLRPCIGR